MAAMVGCSRIHGQSVRNYSLRCRVPFDLTDGTSTYLLDLASSSSKQDICTRGNVVAASASNHAIKLYSRDTLQFQKQLIGHEDRISAIQFSSENPQMLWSASQDATIRCWDTRMDQGSCQVRIVNSKHNVPFHSLGINPSDTVMVAGTAVDNEDVHIILWDLRSYQEVARFSEAHSDDITQVKFSSVDPYLFSTGSMDGLVCVFDTRLLSEEDSLTSILNAEASVAKVGFFGPSEDFIFALTCSETFCIWHAKEASRHSHLLNIRESLKETFQMQVDYFVDCSFHSPSGRLYVLGGDNEGNLYILNAGINGFVPLAVLTKGHTELIRCADWDHERESLITGGEDGYLCHWHQPDVVLEDRTETQTRKISSVADSRSRRKVSSMPY